MVAMAQPYIISYVETGSGSFFTATKGSGTVANNVTTITAAIDAIKTHANKADCEIQFGNDEELDLGNTSITFDNSGSDWGHITLSGKITSSYQTSNSNNAACPNASTICLKGNASVESRANIKNTKETAIRNNGNGTLTINGGTISGGQFTIYNNSNGEINISSGTVSATKGYAIHSPGTGTKIKISGDALITSAGAFSSTIFIGSTLSEPFEMTGGTVTNTNTQTDGDGIAIDNNSTGNVVISGGTVSAKTGAAIALTTSDSKLAISGDAIITSANKSSSTSSSVNIGTVSIKEKGTLEVTGGTITNTVADGKAIYNAKDGTIKISDGTVSATTGVAIHNNSSGKVTVNGGIISATKGPAIRNYSTGEINISGGTISAETGSVVYNGNGNEGNITISGGNISATTDCAVISSSLGKLTISGDANITSENTTTTSGTVCMHDSYKSTSTRLEIIGGTIINSATKGNAVYWDVPQPTIPFFLGGNPNIVGNMKSGQEKLYLGVNAAGDNIFTPEAGRIYTLDFAVYSASSTAVRYGKNFLANFTTADDNWGLAISGNDLVLEKKNTTSSSSIGTSSSSSALLSSSSSSTLLSSSSSSALLSSSSSSSSSEITPIRLAQIVVNNNILQINNGINLQVINNAVIEIYNLNGKLIGKYNFDRGVYNVSLGYLTKGLYVIKATFGSEKKIVRTSVVQDNR